MTLPPGRGYRVCPVNHERIKTSPADRPRSRKTGRASADNHDMLIHDASLAPSPAAVNKTHPATQPGPSATEGRTPDAIACDVSAETRCTDDARTAAWQCA